MEILQPNIERRLINIISEIMSINGVVEVSASAKITITSILSDESVEDVLQDKKYKILATTGEGLPIDFCTRIEKQADTV